MFLSKIGRDQKLVTTAVLALDLSANFSAVPGVFYVD